MWIRSARMRRFFSDNGLEPAYDGFCEAYYIRSQLLDELLFRYTVIYDCIPNRRGY